MRRERRIFNNLEVILALIRWLRHPFIQWRFEADPYQKRTLPAVRLAGGEARTCDL